MTYNDSLVSLAAHAKFARWSIWTNMTMSIAFLPAAFLITYFRPSDLDSSVGIAIAIGSLLYALMLGALIACIVAIPLWTYRAWANLYELGLRGLKRSAGWATTSYFIPIVNLFIPFLAMRELYNRSTGEDEDRANASVADVTSWWTCLMATIFVQLFILAVAIFNLNGLAFIATPPTMNYALIIIANLLTVGASWFLIRAIRDITVGQSSSAGISETFA